VREILRVRTRTRRFRDRFRPTHSLPSFGNSCVGDDEDEDAIAGAEWSKVVAALRRSPFESFSWQYAGRLSTYGALLGIISARGMTPSSRLSASGADRAASSGGSDGGTVS
jgi:hypothetical protein